MYISLDNLRDALSKDDLPFINSKLAPLKEEAIASLLPTVGLKNENDEIQIGSELDRLSDRYIVEYCRAALDGVDNGRTILSLQVQIQALIR